MTTAAPARDSCCVTSGWPLVGRFPRRSSSTARTGSWHRQVERRAVSHLVRGASHGYRMAGRSWWHSRFHPMVRRDSEPIRQRVIEFAQQPAEPHGPARRPPFSHVDNVAAQRRLLREELGVERIALAYGWSMGAQQALHWGVLHRRRSIGSWRCAEPHGHRRTTRYSWRGCELH